MRQLNHQEKLDIVKLLLVHSSYKATIIFNSNENLERPISRSTVERLRQKLLKTGTIIRKKRSDISTIRKPFWIPRLVQRYFLRHPHTTLNHGARKFKMCKKTILKILKRGKFKAYKCTITQELYAGDEEKRLKYCEEILRRFNRNPFLKPNILWSDECLFPLNGIFNRQNYR